MELKRLFQADDDRAVSPVIGVILMVAITVILAAVIGTFVLGLGDSVESAPQATLQIQENTDDPNKFDVRHRGGDRIDFNDFDVVIDGSTDNDGSYSYGGTENLGDDEYSTADEEVITVGQSETITIDGEGSEGEEEVTVSLVHGPSENIVLERTVTIDFD